VVVVDDTLPAVDGDVSLGVLIPTGKALWGAGSDSRDLLGFGTRAEDLGYDSLFVNDSLLTPRIEALTMLAALAPLTSRATLGTGALLPFLRRPVQAAQALASIDLLSGGRLVVAVGGGYPGRFGKPLYDLSELPWDRRFVRLDETVSLWRRLWLAEGPTSFHGEILHFDDIPPSSAVSRPGGPPIWLGGASPGALARTGLLYDGWFPYPPDPSDYRAGLDQVRKAATDAGRDAEGITPALFVSVLVADNLETARGAMNDYAMANYGLSLDALETIQAVIVGSREHVIAQLNSYVEAGARHLVARLGTLDFGSQLRQLERLADIRTAIRPNTARATADGGTVRPDWRVSVPRQPTKEDCS
jgi:alkanesulfonate monooxygenase SsuD/methylene tetrahydromethanopterin reductase-like flavin-dependent oxidoreductase (luciferase family)